MSHNVALPPSEHTPKKKSFFHRQRKDHHKPGMEKNLSHIYHGHGDMSQLDRAKSPWKKRVLIGLLAFLAVSTAVAWGAFFVYRPDQGQYTGEGVAVTIDGPSEIESGAKATYTVSVRNDGSDPLGSAGLHLRLPDVFRVLSDSADMNNVTAAGEINVGAIPPHETRTYTMSGIFITTTDKIHDLQTVLTYHTVNFNAEFQAVATKSVHVNGSILNISGTGPKKTIAGESVALEIVVSNPSDREMERIVVQADYPIEFVPEKSSPTATDNTNSEWEIATLAPGKETKIRVTGSFTSAAKGAYLLPFSIYFANNNSLLFQEKTEIPVEVTEGDLLVALVANGRTENQSFGFGDTLRYSISYRNIGDSVIEDTSVTLHLDTTPTENEVLSWNDLKDAKRGVRKANTLTWTKKQIAGLAKIAPHGEGVIEISIPIISSPQKNSGNDNYYSINAFAEANIATIDGHKVKRNVKSSPVLAVLHSDTTLDVLARYYNEDGQVIGSGPLPPKQGETTTYHVEFTVENSLHELSDLQLNAVLPEGAIVVGTPQADAGVVNIDAKNKTLKWDLNWMPISVGTLKIRLDIAFTPTKDMVGKIPNILDGISLKAKDKTLDSAIATFNLSMPALTTSLERDEKAAGKGKVE